MQASDILTPVELECVTLSSDLRGAWLVVCQWGAVLLIFTIVAIWLNPVTLALGTLLLGARQLGFFVLTHEAGHRTLFKTPALNSVVGEWLLAATDFTDARGYMREHLLHHRAAGTKEDPDIANYVDYPITRERLRRKLKRDITGQTGWRTLQAKCKAMTRLSEQPADVRAALVRGAVVNVALLGVLTALGVPWLYLMWLTALVFVQPLVARVRQIAEHAAVPALDDPDPRLNTRTIEANLLERAFICPHGVSYHVEHHLLPSAPIYRLRLMHKLLKDKGYFEATPPVRGYGEMLRHVTTLTTPVPAL